MHKQDSVCYYKTSPEIIQLVVVLYVRFPLSLRNVEDLLHERGNDALGDNYSIGPAKSLEYSFINRSTKINVMISVNFLLMRVAGRRLRKS